MLAFSEMSEHQLLEIVTTNRFKVTNTQSAMDELNRRARQRKPAKP